MGPTRWPARIGIGLALTAALAAAAALAVRQGQSRPAAQPDAVTWNQIRRAANSGQADRARALLTRYLDAHPESDQALVHLARIEIQAGRIAQARSALERVPPSAPRFAEASFLLGELSLQEHDAPATIEHFLQAASADPRGQVQRRRLIYLYSLEIRPQDARRILLELYRIRDDPRILVDLGLDELRDRGDVRGIAPELAAFHARHPDDPFLARAWGLKLLYEGKPAEAEPLLQQAKQSLILDPASLSALAECLLARGAGEQALAVLVAGCSEHDHPALRVERGRLLENLDRTFEAIGEYERAVALDPQNQVAHLRLGRLLQRAGREPEARAFLQTAHVLEQQRARARLELNQARKQGIPNDSRLFEHLAQVCLEGGLTGVAQCWIERALAMAPERSSASALKQRIEARMQQIAAWNAPPQVRVRGVDVPVEAITAAPTQAAQSTGAIVLEDRAQASGVEYEYNPGAGARLHIADTMGGGVGLLDYDGDGWLDIYFVGGCSIPWDHALPPAPNKLYRNLGNGRFRDVTQAAQAGGAGYGMGCATGDYDNDGDVDLFITGFDRTILYQNQGNGRFVDVTSSAGLSCKRWTTACGFADLDQDGDLDLIAGCYVRASIDDPSICRDDSGRPIHCPPARYQGQSSLLFRNNGDGTFTDCSQPAGFQSHPGKTLGLAIADYDDDGKLDVYLANDGVPNLLFHNLGQLRFEEVGESWGAATNGAGAATASMGIVATDLSGTGRVDLFIANLVNESSTFLRNLGGGNFFDATLGSGLDAATRSRTGFGAAAIDLENDGREDLFMACGHVDDRPWANSAMPQHPLLLRSVAAGRFAVASSDRSPYLERAVVGRGVAAGDLDNDGRVDLVVVHRSAPAAILYNRTQAGHWLLVKLTGQACATPFGARLRCLARGRWIERRLTSGMGYLSAHDSRIAVGLGPDATIDRLQVVWPSGRIQQWENLAADTIVEIVEGRTAIRRLSRSNNPPQKN